MKQMLIAIGGPTATGKSDVAIELAEKCSGEVINCDIMQSYIGMDIGTAKVTPNEMKGIAHHLIDIWPAQTDATIAMFATKAINCIQEVLKKGKIPILCGGSGLYLDSVIYENFDFSVGEPNPILRKSLEALATNEGNEAVYAKLVELDREYASKVHPNNLKRVIRAIEYITASGEKRPVLQSGKRKPYRFEGTHYFVLFREREELYALINARVDRMVDSGLFEEAESLLKAGVPTQSNAMQAIGYKESLRYLRGEWGREEAIAQIKQASRRYAKRQLTWFRRNPEATWINMCKLTANEAALQILKDIKHEQIENDINNGDIF